MDDVEGDEKTMQRILARLKIDMRLLIGLYFIVLVGGCITAYELYLIRHNQLVLSQEVRDNTDTISDLLKQVQEAARARKSR